MCYNKGCGYRLAVIAAFREEFLEKGNDGLGIKGTAKLVTVVNQMVVIFPPATVSSQVSPAAYSSLKPPNKVVPSSRPALRWSRGVMSSLFPIASTRWVALGQINSSRMEPFW